MKHVLVWLLATSSLCAMADEGEHTAAPCRCEAPSTWNCSSRNLTALATADSSCSEGAATLDASQNQLESLDLGNWTGDVLNVSHNLLVDIGDSAPWMPRVKVLDASWNGLKTLNAGAMENLQELFLSDNSLTTIQLPESECKLQRVNVANNNLTQLPAELKNCSALSSFDASNNTIEHLPEDIMQLLDMERMSENLTVDLRGNPLPEAVVASVVEGRGCLRVPLDAGDCSCVSFRGQRAVLTLCVSSPCDLWTRNAAAPCPTTVAPQGEDVGTTTRGRAQAPPATTPQSAPHSSTDAVASPPSREERRRGRLALALILTAVALALGAALVGALVLLYRRRRREVRREAEATRLALKPLVSDTTPRCMRSTDRFSS